MRRRYSSRDVITLLEMYGWQFVHQFGSHQQFVHPVRPGRVTVPHPSKELHPRTAGLILRLAGIKEE